MIAQTFLLAVLLTSHAMADQQQGVDVANPVKPVPVQLVSSHPHGVPVEVAEGPVAGAEVVPSQAGAPVEHHHHVHHNPQPQPQYYSPSGVIQVVDQAQAQQHQPAGPVVEQYKPKVQHPAVLKQYSAAPGAEQYGQPESASIPPNYKPWGAWGLYIGGNPADGYYSSYYKALSNSVAADKQQVVAPESSSSPVKPSGPQAVVSQASGFAGQSPLLKQGSFPYTYQDQGYPYDSYYTPADLNSGSRVSVAPQGSYQGQYGPSVYSYPVDSQPAPYPGVSGLSYAADLSYAAAPVGSTKRLGSSSPSYATKSREVQVPVQVPAKGYHYSYAAAPVHAYSPSMSQVVAYPVPVGSQIVGSQPDAEGSFQPFGVHGFTRYAIKPTVVASAPSNEQYSHPQPQGVHSAPVSQFPVYKQVVGYQQPLSFYGYPLSQLHYSQGSLAPAFGPHGVDSAPSSPVSPSSSSSVSGVQQPSVVSNSPAVFGFPVGAQVEAASSDKSESKVEQAVASKPASQQ